MGGITTLRTSLYYCAARLRRFLSEREGAALVEAALTFPIIVVIGMLTTDFSYWLYSHQAMTSGVRDAARYLARTSSPSDPSYQTKAANIACGGDASDSASERVKGCIGHITITSYNIANTGLNLYRGPAQIAYYTVTSDFTYQGFGFLSAFGFSGANIPLRISHTERWIGG